MKYAAKLLNLCGDDVRLPLVKVTDSTMEEVKKALKSAKLIQEWKKNQYWFKDHLLE